MSTPRQLQVLISDMISEHPSAQFEYDPLPSGVCILSVSLNGREFELDYHPKNGTGVSENFADTPPFIGHDEAFASLDDATARFKALLFDASLHGDPSRIRTAYVMNDKPISK